MRTSVTLDDDVHEFASVYAEARGITLGAALGELVRKAKNAARPASASIRILPNGMPVFRSRGGKLTPEVVRAAQEDDDA